MIYLQAATVNPVEPKTGETVRGGSRKTHKLKKKKKTVVDNELILDLPLDDIPGEDESGNDIAPEIEDADHFELSELEKSTARWERNANLRTEYLDLAEQVKSLIADGNQAGLAEVVRKQQRVMEVFYEENKRLAFKIAKHFGRMSDNAKDYEQDASEGLIVAFHRWDPKLSTFGTFSQTFIKGKVNRGFNSVEFGDRSYGDHTAAPRVLAAQIALADKLGRRATHAEIAEAAETTLGVVGRVLTGKPLRLDAPIYEDGRTLGDDLSQTMSSNESLAEADPVLVNQVLHTLSARELWTIINRDGLGMSEPMTLAAISSEIAVGRESLRRDEDKARDRMREHLTSQSLNL